MGRGGWVGDRDFLLKVFPIAILIMAASNTGIWIEKYTSIFLGE